MTAVGTSVAVVLTALGVPVAGMSVYQLILAVAAFFYRPGPSAVSGPRLVILIPAHDEAALIGRCVRSLSTQTYAAAAYEVVVIADNCTDDTAALAEAAGGRVLVRDESDRRGKGQALRWALDQLLSEPGAPDGVVVVDADSEAQQDFLAIMAGRFSQGADAVQGESLLTEDGSRAAAFRAAAFLLVNRVRPAGRAVLGAPAHLAGNGMLLRREVLQAYPWDAFTSAEDLEYAVKLRMVGIRVVFAGGAVLRSPAAPNPTAAAEQQLRWEGGKVHLARTRIPSLVKAAFRERRPMLLEAALELAMPPLGFLTGAAAVGAIAAGALVLLDIVSAWTAVLWLVAVASLALYVLVGLRAGRAPASAYRALVGAPLFILAKLLRVRGLLRFRGDTWVRTERAEEESRGEPE